MYRKISPEFLESCDILIEEIFFIHINSQIFKVQISKPILKHVFFLYQFFNADIVPAHLKACHFVGKIDESAIFVKFLYFGQKNVIWRNKKTSKGFSNPANGKPY